MNLKEKVSTDLKEAMKAREPIKLSVLRMVKAAIKYREIEKGHELNDDEVVEVLAKEVKIRQDSLIEYEKAKRAEAVETIKQEILVLMDYLPQQMTSDEIKALVKKIVAEVGAQSAKEMGKVMGKVLPLTKGRAEGKLVQQIVISVLNGDD